MAQHDLSARPRICFYQSRHYRPLEERAIVRHYDPARLHAAEKFADRRRVVMEYFEEVTFQRAGILEGEYVAANIGVLVRRDGMLIKMNMLAEEPWASRKMDELCASPQLQANIKLLQKAWDRLPVVEDLPLLSHPYHDNYFHWSLEVVPNLRFFSGDGPIAVCEPCLHRSFQRDLLARAAGGRKVCPLKGPVVVRNPRLSCTTMSQDAVRWLRHSTKITTSAGPRRLYLRRSGSSKRWPPGGGLAESADFLDFLTRNGFETVDFGSAERSIEEQVQMLDGAAVILAPHGAALTNLAYLAAPLTVIEVMGPRTMRAMFAHISSICGFDHHAVFVDIYDEAGDLMVAPEDLQAALDEAAPRCS